MERELWTWLMVGLRDVSRSFRDSAYHTHSTATIVRTYLWAVLHDRPTVWACDPRAWDHATRPPALPSQPTMSRRLRHPDVTTFMQRLGQRLNGTPGNKRPSEQPLLEVKAIDGRPLVVAEHTADPDAATGYAHRRFARGYKLHLIDADSPMPAAFAVEPLNVSEQATARQLIPQLTGVGYLLGDTNYHATELFDLAHQHGHRLLAPRQRTRQHAALGHRRQSPHRLDCIARLEQSPRLGNRFATQLLKLRRRVESAFAHAACFGAGLHQLPTWVRRLHRVKTYVHAKLLINAARIRQLRE